MAIQERSLVCAVARVVLAFVWIYHGVVPKLLCQHADEQTILRQAGIDAAFAPAAVRWIGLGEVLVGLVFLALPRARWPFLLTIVFGVLATAGLALQSPEFLVAAFNPVSLNVQMIALSAIGLLSSRKFPTAG